MATIGTVTYPDGIAGTTWEVAVTDLPSGSSTLTVSDGTDSVQATVMGPIAETTYPSDTEWSVLIPASEAPGTFEAAASSGEVATVEVAPPLGGTAAGQATAAGSITKLKSVDGTAAGKAQVLGQLSQRIQLGGTAAGKASPVAAPTMGLKGTAAGKATVQVLPSIAATGAAVTGGQAGASGQLSVALPLSGAAAGQAEAFAGLAAPGADAATVLELRAVGAGGATATAKVPRLVAIEGVSGRAAVILGLLGGSADVGLSGIAAGGAGAVATGLQGFAPLTGTAAGHGQASGSVAPPGALSGTAAGKADAGAVMTRPPVPLTGTAAGKATVPAVTLAGGQLPIVGRLYFWDGDQWV